MIFLTSDYFEEKDKKKDVIEYIAEQVINKITDRQKIALLLFTGATLGFEQSLEALKLLRADGWKFKSAMSSSAERVLDKQLVQELSPEDEIITENSNADLKSLIKNCNIVIIPVLTINTASKTANCISDSLVTNIISGSMKSGKIIIACINACCPDNEERNSKGFYVTDAFKEKLRNNLNILRSYGIYLTAAENLFNKVNKAALKNSGLLESRDSSGRCIDYNKGTVVIKNKVINRGCILNNLNYSIMKVDKDSVITKLAEDEAEKRNITLIKE